MGDTRDTDGASPGGDVPKVFVSYAHGDDAWQATVLDFATALRTVGGIDADLDEWHRIEPSRLDWTTYGPTAIRNSDFTLIAASPAYKAAWDGENPSGVNAGAAREAFTIKGLFDLDQREFRQRIRVVVLPGARSADIPLDLLAGVDRFEITSFDLEGLEDLLRALLNRPRNPLPKPSPLPALPPSAIADMPEEPRSSAGSQTERVTPPLEPAPDNIEIADKLAEKLAAIDRKLASRRSGEADGETDEERPEERLEDTRAAVIASLEAVERALPVGARRQRMVGDYLNAELYLSAGAFRAADERLGAVRGRLGDPAALAADAVLERCLLDVTDVMIPLNERMRDRRYAAQDADDPLHRHPLPPEMELEPDRSNGVRRFYEVARYAMNEEPRSSRARSIIRDAILRRRAPPEKHAARLYERYTRQQAIAGPVVPLRPASPAGEPDGAEYLLDADLHSGGGSVAADVLVALAKAHLQLYLVEHRRSGPVDDVLNRERSAIDEDRATLRCSIVLNTFAQAISETMPWIFAATVAERTAIQSDVASAVADLHPAPAMWHARQVTLLALYRRSHGFRLLGDHERAYKDLRKLQRIGRTTRSAGKEDGYVGGWLDTLDVLSEYRIGELYRADHDYMQALVHLCRSHDSVQLVGRLEGSLIAKELGHLEVKLCLGKAKAFFEIGAMKRSLKWHLTAWRWLLTLEQDDARGGELIKGLEDELDIVKLNPVLDKRVIQDRLRPVVKQICGQRLKGMHDALAADILVRISHLLTVLRLPEDDSDCGPDTMTSAVRCLKRAAELDERNLLVQTGLLRHEMHRPGSVGGMSSLDPLLCWPSGASDVDQVIRAAEHLMLSRLNAAGRRAGIREAAVARALMAHFMTHTDSINLRGAILHRYLMRGRAEDRDPWWAGAGPNGAQMNLPAVRGSSERYLEFVCLRRFGSFTPFMPRPAAVSAVGGGYLVRICEPSRERGGEHQEVFNIIVDPGEGAVNNLYGMGLSIADLDMVVASHDHPEHLAALDAILSLRKEFQQRVSAGPGSSGGSASGWDERRRLLILGNRSVVNRYSFLNGDEHHLVQHIADASVLGGCEVPDGVTITALPTKHVDLGGHHANGFVLSYSPAGRGGGEAPVAITFMADTAVAGLRKDLEPAGPIDARWKRALASDIVVAHVSDVPSGELRALADLSAKADAYSDEIVARFDAGVRKLARERPADASQLMHALSLVPPDPRAHPGPVSLLSDRAVEVGEQLYLAGLLDVCEQMAGVAVQPGGGARILIVGELKEQLGSFRGTIAREINRTIFGLPDDRHDTAAPELIALTADIGLRIRLGIPTGAVGGARDRNTVLCSTCSYNNDRLDIERFHAAQDIYEVCVKGDHEAIYWNCGDLHDPGRRVPPTFIEQMGSYNPFAAGGRYHG